MTNRDVRICSTSLDRVCQKHAIALCLPVLRWHAMRLAIFNLAPPFAVLSEGKLAVTATSNSVVSVLFQEVPFVEYHPYI